MASTLGCLCLSLLHPENSCRPYKKFPDGIILEGGAAGLAAVDNVGDVAIPVSLIKFVRAPGAGEIAVETSQQTADAARRRSALARRAGAPERAAQVAAASVTDGGR